jgi:hypothetical protein
MVTFQYLSRVGNIPVFQFRSSRSIGNTRSTVLYNSVLNIVLYCSTVGAKIILWARSLRETKLASTKLPLFASFVITHAFRFIKIPHGIRIFRGSKYYRLHSVNNDQGVPVTGRYTGWSRYGNTITAFKSVTGYHGISKSRHSDSKIPSIFGKRYR